METITHRHNQVSYPQELTRLTKPPEALYVKGRALSDVMSRPRVAIVGTRSITAYGRQVTRDIAKQLAERGVVIVSGLAYGVDAEAHRAALDAGGITVAILPSSVESVVPTGNQPLARQILASGGALMSTYPTGSVNHKGNFVQRNEYVAALSQVVIITEAAQKSGSRHTAEFATSSTVGIPVFAVPGSILSPQSVGTNNLIHAEQAKIYTTIQDVTEAIGLGRQLTLSSLKGDTPAEQILIDLLLQGTTDGQELLARSQLDISTYNQTLTMLEISAKVRPLGANNWGLA